MLNQSLISYHNNPKLKQETIHRMEQHIKADELIQGEGFNKETNKGCAIGCSIDCYDHKAFSEKLGLDLWIPKMYDRIHEGLASIKKCGTFDLGLLRAIPLGKTKKETDKIRLRLLHYILTEILPKKYQTNKETAKIITLFEQAINGKIITSEQWLEAKRAAAYAAAAYAAAAYADAAYAAAYAAAAYADAADARQSSFEKIGNKLIELFEEELNKQK